MWKSGRRLCRWWRRSSHVISQQVTEESASNGNGSENSGKMQTSPASLDLEHWPADSSTSSQYICLPANISLFLPASRPVNHPEGSPALIKVSTPVPAAPASPPLPRCQHRDARRCLQPFALTKTAPLFRRAPLPARACLSAPDDSKFTSCPVQRLSLCSARVGCQVL